MLLRALGSISFVLDDRYGRNYGKRKGDSVLLSELWI